MNKGTCFRSCTGNRGRFFVPPRAVPIGNEAPVPIVFERDLLAYVALDDVVYLAFRPSLGFRGMDALVRQRGTIWQQKVERGTDPCSNLMTLVDIANGFERDAARL